jgi:hypothetical protein
VRWRVLELYEWLFSRLYRIPKGSVDVGIRERAARQKADGLQEEQAPLQIFGEGVLFVP